MMLLILSISSGILYRMGGSKNWNTKWRDAGVPLLTMIAVLTNNIPSSLFGWLMIGLMFGLMFASLTTYWDWINGKDNFYLHGLFIGLAMFPLMWVGISGYLIIARSLLLAVNMGLLNSFVNKYKVNRPDLIEEIVRGMIIILSLFILFF